MCEWRSRVHAARGRKRGQSGRRPAPLLGQRQAEARPDGVPALQHQRVGELDRADGLGLRRPRRPRRQCDRDVAGRARCAAGVRRRGAARADAGAAGPSPGVRRASRDGSRARGGGDRRRVVRAGLRPGGRRLGGHHPDPAGAQRPAPRDLRHHQRADRRQRGVGLGGVGRDLRRPPDQRRPDRLVAPRRRAAGDGRRLRRGAVVCGRPRSRRPAPARRATTSERRRRGGRWCAIPRPGCSAASSRPSTC